jgi:hypothetical protein
MIEEAPINLYPKLIMWAINVAFDSQTLSVENNPSLQCFTNKTQTSPLYDTTALAFYKKKVYDFVSKGRWFYEGGTIMATNYNIMNTNWIYYYT